MANEKRWFTYILKCADNTLYTGYTNNLAARVATHNSGKGAKYTRSRLPVHLFYYETHKTQSLAMQREYAIKQLPRRAKLALQKTPQE